MCKGVKPRDVFLSSDKTFIFECYCGHEINMVLKNISCQNHWCSYCSHQLLCPIEIDCKKCYENSFASVKNCDILWSLNNKLKPRQVFKSSSKKYLFCCIDCNNEYEKIISDITKGIGCPNCFNKTEKKLKDKLIKYYKSLKRQYKVEWCKNIRFLPFDFVIIDKNNIIELCGKQHMVQVGNWLPPNDTRKNDVYKMNCANDNGFSVIRILQNDVWKDKYDWLTELRENIEKIINDGIVQNIYMCKNNEYDKHIADMSK